MAKSSAAGLAALALAAPAWGQDREDPANARAVLQTYQAELRAAVEVGCERDVEPGAIIVCGRRGGEPFRVPPDPPEPGERVGLVAGELPSAMGALGAGGCLRLCHQPVKVEIISAVRGISRAIGRIRDR